MLALLWQFTYSRATSGGCPPWLSHTDSFTIDRTPWLSCEDLSRPDGDLLLVPNPATGLRPQSFSKTYEPYVVGTDDDYYLNVSLKMSDGRVLTGKAAVASASADILGAYLLNTSTTPFLTRELVARALPPLKGTGTFVGSRSASVDTTLTPMGEDANSYGFPALCEFILNGSSAAQQLRGATCMTALFNSSSTAEGLVGGHLPVVRFVFPIARVNTSNVARFWEMIAAAVPDSNGSREQPVWFKYQQLQCTNTTPGQAITSDCDLFGKPIYFDTFWWSGLGASRDEFGPVKPASAAGFYANLLAVQQYCKAIPIDHASL